MHAVNWRILLVNNCKLNTSNNNNYKTNDSLRSPTNVDRSSTTVPRAQDSKIIEGLG